MRYMKSSSKPVLFQINETGYNEQPVFKMTRNAERVLPEQKDRPNMITLKPLPHKPIKEKVIK